MRTLSMLILVFFLMAALAGAFRNEPLGWCGWLWGTPFNDIAGWLAYSGIFEYDDTVSIYKRQNETKEYFGRKWSEAYYFFKDGILGGVILAEKDAYDLEKVINPIRKALLQEYGDLPPEGL